MRPGPREAAFGYFLKIGIDGRVTLAVPQVETGQGIWTGLAQTAADELGAAWESMAVEPAPYGTAYANRIVAQELGVTTRITAGSSSIRSFERPIREAAATARVMLCRAAAERWGVRAAECDTEGGFIVHEGKRLAFGEVAVDAAGLRPPDSPPVRAAGSGKLAGEPLPRLDLPAKSNGSLRFAGDVRLPRMLFASVRMAPSDGRLLGFSREAARRQQGLTDLVVRDGWLAALGDSWWAADNALAKANPRFSASDPGQPMELIATALERGKATRIFERGDYSGAVEGSTPLAATYTIAPALHASLEAPSAVARLTGDRIEVWSGTQIADLARSAAARAAGTAEDNVTVYSMPVGDGSGGAFDLDAVTIAVELARHAGRPVSLCFPPAVARNRDAVRSPMIAQMAALPASNGTISAWRGRIAGTASLAAVLGKSDKNPSMRPDGSVPSYAIPAIRLDWVNANLPIRTGYMRGGEEAALSFANESFIDELARALGAEPLAFRMGMLGGAPRLAKAIMTAAAIGGWDGGGPGSSLGLACASHYGSHIGLLAEATIGADQKIKVSRLVAAVDAGRIANSGLVQQQIEGGLLAALAIACVPAPEFVAGMPRAAPMRGRAYERLHEVPKIEIELIRNDEEPGGVSGLGMAVLAPAVANALAASSGKRLRNLPFDPMSAP